MPRRRRFYWGRFLLLTAATIALTVVLACASPYRIGHVWALASSPAPAAPEGTVEQGTVVQIFTFWGAFVGSACVVAHTEDETFLITAHHVVDDGIPMRTAFGLVRTETVHDDQDLALISVPAIFGTAWELGSRLDFGDPVRAMGYYKGIPTMTRGHVANPAAGWIDATFGYGMSGGAVCDEEGRLVGIVESTFEPIDIGVMVNVEHARTLMEEVLE